MTFKKGRQLSNLCYVIAAAVIVYKILCMPQNDILGILVYAVGILLIAAGAYIYNQYCVCPNCGEKQPRYYKNSCYHCGSDLNAPKD